MQRPRAKSPGSAVFEDGEAFNFSLVTAAARRVLLRMRVLRSTLMGPARGPARGALPTQAEATVYIASST